jgi:hypothetical protein
LRVETTGAYVDPLTGRIKSLPCDLLYIASNINNEGNIESLDRLLCHEGRIHFFNDYTPGGSSLRERLCDLESLVYSKNGDPECCLSQGMVIISRDSSRLTSYLCYRTSALLAQSCLEESDLNEILEQITALVRIMGIVENEDENLITKQILIADGFGGEDLRQRALASFADRTDKSQGPADLQNILDSIYNIVNSDIESVYKPLMKDKAMQHFNLAIETVSKFLEQSTKKPDGLMRIQHGLQSIKIVLEKASESISQKINGLQEQLQPHEEIIAETYEKNQQLSQMNFAVRAFLFFTMRNMVQTLLESGKALISYCIELAVCEIALQEVVIPLLDEIDSKLGWILAEIEKLHKIEKFCNNEAEQLINHPTIFSAPVGLELTDREFLENKFQEYIEEANGEENFKNNMRLSFLNKYESFSILFQASMNEIIDLFNDFGSTKYKPDVIATDVLDELFQKDRRTIQEIFARIIPQCDGRVQVQGQANEYVPRIKVASVPSEKHVPVVTELLENFDSNSGKWQVVVNPADRDSFNLVQVRSRISLTQFIDRINLPDTYESWKMLIENAVDPVAVTIAGPNPSNRQLKRILAKAIICGLLTEAKNGFMLKTFTGESILFRDHEAAQLELRTRFRDTVFIESTFARDLVVDEDKIIGKLKTAMSDIVTADQKNSLLAVTDKTGIQESLEQAELLLPRLRRMRKYNPRNIL